MLNTIDIIADAYDRQLALAHDYPPPNYMRMAYARAATWLNETAQGLARATGYTVLPVPDPEPYPDPIEQARTTRRAGVFLVSNMHCDHALFSPADNINLRVVHDWIGHAVIDRSVDAHHVPGFDTAGELHAWRRLRHYLEATTPYHVPGNSTVWHVLYAELLGQTAYFAKHGTFPTLSDGVTQPALLLDLDPRDGVDL